MRTGFGDSRIRAGAGAQGRAGRRTTRSAPRRGAAAPCAARRRWGWERGRWKQYLSRWRHLRHARVDGTVRLGVDAGGVTRAAIAVLAGFRAARLAAKSLDQLFSFVRS